MPIDVTMAKLSPTMESGQVVRWLVKIGDKVKAGDNLAEIQTDKAVMPMESFEDGVVAHFDVKEGEDVSLGQRVLVLAEKDEDYKAVAQKAAKQGKPVAAAPATAATPAPVSEESAAVEAAVPSASNGQDAAVGDGGRVKSTPLARKIASEARVDINTIPGSGPGGRVIREDVEAFLQRRPPRTTAATAPASPARAAATASGASAPAVPVAPGKPTRIPHSPMRKTIAKRMAESKAAVPEIHVTVDVRIDALLATREALNAQLSAEKVKLSVGDFVTKAAATALRAHPLLNASFEPDAVVVHSDVNIGIAVALEEGLMVPVLHNADTLGLKAIRNGTEALASATRNGTLKPNQMMGGTFTISNLGMFGVKHFDAIINLPEVAILAVGSGEKRPVVEGDQLVVGTVMTLTLTADHRVVDGATAAEFMRTLKGYLEQPARMLL